MYKLREGLGVFLFYLNFINYALQKKKFWKTFREETKRSWKISKTLSCFTWWNKVMKRFVNVAVCVRAIVRSYGSWYSHGDWYYAWSKNTRRKIVKALLDQACEDVCCFS